MTIKHKLFGTYRETVLLTRLIFVIFTASSPTSGAQVNLAGLRNNSLTNQDVSFDPCGDNRLRNSCMSLDEKTRTMSRSGSFRDGFEEGKRRRATDDRVEHAAALRAEPWPRSLDVW